MPSRRPLAPHRSPQRPLQLALYSRLNTRLCSARLRLLAPVTSRNRKQIRAPVGQTGVGLQTKMQPAADIVASHTPTSHCLVVAPAAAQIAGPARTAGLLPV